MLLRSPAKINLYLRVGPRRADGFHSLTSWFCSVGLEDLLDFQPRPGGELSMSCDRDGVPCDERNLVLRAAKELMAYCPRQPGLHINLKKRIPTGGGLGGGSSNAATTLQALEMLWGCRITPEQMQDVAARLGSDVPFFFHLPSAICRGRGELVTPIEPPKASAALLILPAIEMPTPAVYQQFDAMNLGTDLDAIEPNLPDPALPTRMLLKALVNDLEAPAFALSPELAQLRDKCQKQLSRPVRMSGSGSTLFTLYDELEEAREAADHLQLGSATKTIACGLGVLP